MSTGDQASFPTGDTRNQGLASLRARVREHWDSLSRAEISVCNMLKNCPAERLLYASAQDLGAESGTSNATVIRTLQRLGYSGLPELKHEVAASFTKAVAPDVRVQQRMERIGDDLPRIWDQVFDEARERIDYARRVTDAPTLTAAVKLLVQSREIVAYGLGASGIAAAHLVLQMNRIGRRARHIASDGFRLADDLLLVGRGDVVVIFAPGRMLPDIDVLLDRSKDVGAHSILVSDELAGQLSDRVDVCVTSPHTPTGLTSDALTGLVVGDALIQAVASLDHDLAVESSHELTSIRQQLGY